MPVKLRLQRQGRTHRAFFRIVAADARSPRDGRFIEKLGTFDPHKQFDRYELDAAAALKWLQQGAQPTDTVKNILSEEGVLLRHHLHKQGKTAEEIEKAYQDWKTTRDKKQETAQFAIQKSKTELASAAHAQEQAKRKERAAAISARLEEAAKEAAAAAKAAEAEATGEAPADEAEAASAPTAEVAENAAE
ncbi:MAG: 30S ribosomal protein S16 [Bacteroidetes bacterium]|nr:30S ribosomal protein S16 [Bacteroidota bacterium]